jgi:hypothetical protein
MAADGRKHTLHRASEYTIPSFLVLHVKDILSVIHMPPKVFQTVQRDPSTEREEGRMHEQSAAAPGYVYPGLLNEVYQVKSNTGSSNVAQGVFQSIGQTLDTTDLTKFQNTFGLPLQNINFNLGTMKAPYTPAPP